MTRTASFYVDAALTAYNAGFSSKAAQQRAIEDLNRAYALGVKGMIQDELLQINREERDEDWNTLYWGTPDLHNWKPKHSELFARFPENVALAEQLVALRASIKAAPINAPVRAEPSAFEVKVRETIKELHERRQRQYLEALDLSEVTVDGVRVRGLSANSHYVTNEHGTTFIRTFFYLFGKLTPLNTIIAAAEAKAREAA